MGAKTWYKKVIDWVMFWTIWRWRFYRDRDKYPQRGLTRQQALESVGPGWSGIIGEIYDRIEKLRPRSCIAVRQVKEKFGTLRFYYDSTMLSDKKEEEFYLFVEEMAEKSGTICEDCGLPGRVVRVNGWWLTQCDNCIEVQKSEGKTVEEEDAEELEALETL